MAAIFGKRKNFWKLSRVSYIYIYPVGQKFRRNRSISHGLGDTSNFKFYHFCQKLQKFLRIEQSILHIYPVGQKFRRNCSISHGLEVIKGFVFSSLIKILMLNYLAVF